MIDSMGSAALDQGRGTESGGAPGTSDSMERGGHTAP
jgi:hypothetical protein